jgi:hypothetical protein
MDALEFQQQAATDPALLAFLHEVADEVSRESDLEGPASYPITGVDLLFAVAAYAAFRFLKDYFDQRRGKMEAQLLEHQEKVIAALVADGFPPKEARATVVALLKGIAKRTDDDPAFKAARAILKKEAK